MLLFNDQLLQTLKAKSEKNLTSDIPKIALICRAIHSLHWIELAELLDNSSTHEEAEREFAHLLLNIIYRKNPTIPSRLLQSDYGFYSLLLACRLQNAAYLSQAKAVAPGWFYQHSHFATTQKSILMWASQKNDAWSVCWLISNIPSLTNLVDNFGYSALMIATHLGHLSIMQLLLQAGANYRLRTYQRGRTAFLLAASNGQLAACIKLLQTFPSFIHDQDLSGANAYLLAAKHGTTYRHLAVLKYFRKHYPAVTDIHDNQGYNAITWALINSQPHIISWLLSEEAGITPMNAHLHIPFDLCHLLPIQYTLPTKLLIAYQLYVAIKENDWPHIALFLSQLDTDYLTLPGYCQQTLIQLLEMKNAPDPDVIKIAIDGLYNKAKRKEYCLHQLSQQTPIVYPEKFFKLHPHKVVVEYTHPNLLKNGS